MRKGVPSETRDPVGPENIQMLLALLCRLVIGTSRNIPKLPGSGQCRSMLVDARNENVREAIRTSHFAVERLISV